MDGAAAARRVGRGQASPTLARSVRQVDFVICLYTTLPVPDTAVRRGVVLARTLPRRALAARESRRPRSPRIDVESLRYFTAISVMNIDLL